MGGATLIVCVCVCVCVMGGLCQRHLHMAPRVSIYAGPTYCHLQRLTCHNMIG